MIRRILILTLIGLSLTGGVTLNPGRSKQASTKVLFIGDIHWRRPAGGSNKGAARFQALMAWANANGVNHVVLGGDYQWDNASSAERDSIQWMFQDTLLAPSWPITGNHEPAFEDTGSGILYNNFTNRWPELYRPYQDVNRRGSRWWGRRLGDTNVCVFAVNNNRDNPSGDYYVNNPRDGSGVANDDFDGISDSTTVQRQDFRHFVEGTVEPDDWVILAQHRAVHGLATISTRPDQEGGLIDADSSQVVWLDAHLNRHWLLFENDVHENKFMDLYGRHYTISACNSPRAIDSSKLATWASRLLFFALSDTVWTSCTTCTVVDSLGADAASIPATEWGVFWVGEFTNRTAVLRLYLVQYDGDPVTEVGSWTIRQ